MAKQAYCRNIIAVIGGKVIRCKGLPIGHEGLCIGSFNRGRVYDDMVRGDKPQPKMSDEQARQPGANAGLWEISN